MKILALNGAGREHGATTALTRAALEGAESEGAETEMVMLKDRRIEHCRNCLACYRDQVPPVGMCPIQDDVAELIEKLHGADGVIFSSPVHCGFVSGLMVTFMERVTWRLCRPEGRTLGIGGIPEPRSRERVRATATIVTAGCIPTKLRRFCDTATPWLKEQAGLLCNSQPLAEMYGGAVFTRRPSGDDWRKVYDMRQLSARQLEEARGIGVRMVRALRDGSVRPYSLEATVGPVGRLLGWVLSLFGPIETLGKEAPAEERDHG